MIKVTVCMSLLTIAVAVCDQLDPSASRHGDDPPRILADPFTSDRSETWQIPEHLSKPRWIKLAQQPSQKGPHQLRISWVIPPRVSKVVVAPNSEMSYSLNVRLGLDSFRDIAFELPAGKTRSLALSKEAAHDGAGIRIAGKITTGASAKALVLVQQRVEELDEQGRVVSTWFGNEIGTVELIKEK
jgi:hypothetical protein